MKIRQPGAKILLNDLRKDTEESLIPLFHDWIRNNVMDDHLMIDVADYRHVPNGPGVMLIAHEAHLSVERLGGDPGLCYQSKKDVLNEASAQFEMALRHVAKAASRFISGDSSSSFQFSKRKFILLSTSRLELKNTKEAFEKISNDVLVMLEKVFGHNEFSLKQQGDSRAPFSMLVQSSKDIDWSELKD